MCTLLTKPSVISLDSRLRPCRPVSKPKPWFGGALTLALSSAVLCGTAQAQVSPQVLHDNKYRDSLPIPAAMPFAVENGVRKYTVEMVETTQNLHSLLPDTKVWAYKAAGYPATYPGRTFDVPQGQVVQVTWVNDLPTTHLFTIDPTLEDLKPDPMYPNDGPIPDVRAVVHRHGGHQPGLFDGHPDAWFTKGQTEFGALRDRAHIEGNKLDFANNTYTYENNQSACTLWYHDHAAGITRLNVYAGLAGFYLIRDALESSLNLPSGEYEIPLAIQDRTFNEDGSLFYPSVGRWPQNHPNWVKHFHGDVAVVNGKVWPYLEVEPRKYRFRLLNGCNARLLDLALSGGPRFQVIGTELGFLDRPQRTRGVTMEPGERLDVIVDFSGYADGSVFTLLNNERGDGPDLPEILQFRVKSKGLVDNSSLPSVLNPNYQDIPVASAVHLRTLTFEHLNDEHGDPIAFLLDGKFRHEEATERPHTGTVEVWEVINLTSEEHPLHIHMGDSQIINRQAIRATYHDALMEAREAGLDKPDLAPFLKDSAIAPKGFEKGMKDTIRLPGMSVTRVAFRVGDYTGDSVWHCHILEHEDNDMMRPLIVE